MSLIAEPKRIISTAVLARRLDVSRPTLEKHLRRGIITADFKSDAGKFFLPERIGELRQAIADNRAKNWRYLSPIFS